jgi:O-antigen ligase
MICLAAMLLAFYELPTLEWSGVLRLSPLADLRFGAPTAISSLILFAIAITIIVLLGMTAPRSSRLLLSTTTVYIFACGVSIACSSANTESERECSLIVASFTAGLVAAMLCKTPRAIFAVIGTVGTIVAACSLFYYVHGINTVQSGAVIRSGGTFDSPLELAYVLILCLPSVIYWIFQKTNAVILAISVCSGALIISSLYLTYCRSAVVACALAVGYIFLRGKTLRQWFYVGALALTIICVIFVIRGVGNSNEISTLGSWQGRTALWRVGISIFLSHPLTGIGIGNVRIPALSYQGGTRTRVFVTSCMNLPLEWLDELGIAGGVLICAIFASLLHRLQLSEPKDREVILCSMLSIIIVGFVDVPFANAAQYGPTCLVGMLLGTSILLPEFKLAGTGNGHLIEDRDQEGACQSVT